MKPFARRKRRVFFIACITYFISLSVLRRKVIFFLPSGRLVRRLFSFHFPVAGWLRELNKNPKKEPDMANNNTNPDIGKNADSGGCGYIVLRDLPIAKWDV